MNKAIECALTKAVNKVSMQHVRYSGDNVTSVCFDLSTVVLASQFENDISTSLLRMLW